jgi:hypothetical protein
MRSRPSAQQLGLLEKAGHPTCCPSTAGLRVTGECASGRGSRGCLLAALRAHLWRGRLAGRLAMATTNCCKRVVEWLEARDDTGRNDMQRRIVARGLFVGPVRSVLCFWCPVPVKVGTNTRNCQDAGTVVVGTNTRNYQDAGTVVPIPADVGRSTRTRTVLKTPVPVSVLWGFRFFLMRSHHFGATTARRRDGHLLGSIFHFWCPVPV